MWDIIKLCFISRNTHRLNNLEFENQLTEKLLTHPYWEATSSGMISGVLLGSDRIKFHCWSFPTLHWLFISYQMLFECTFEMIAAVAIVNSLLYEPPSRGCRWNSDIGSNNHLLPKVVRQSLEQWKESAPHTGAIQGMLSYLKDCEGGP